MLEKIYLLKLLGIGVLVVVLTIAEQIIFRKIYPKMQASPRIWDEAFIYALHLPLKIGIWLIGLIFAAVTLEQNFMREEWPHSSWLVPVFKISVFLLFNWAFFRFINQFEERYTTSKRGNLTKAHGIGNILRMAVFVISGLGILQFFGIPFSGIIAFGGFGGIVVGFAARDFLANIFGGVMILFDRQFEVGDWIRSPDKEIEGTVEHIGWRLTQIRTFDKRPLFVPNSLFSTIAIENPSRMSNRQIKAKIGLSYEDAQKLEKLLPAIENLMRKYPDIDSKQTCFANLVNFGPHSLEVMIYAFTKTTDGLKFQAVQQDLFLKILNLIAQHEVKIAYPITSFPLH